MPTSKITPAPLTRPLSEIATEILKDYLVRQGKPVYYAAEPYVAAMTHLNDFSSRYYEDTAEDIVIRLLGNLSTWRGETATRVRNELKAALADYQAKRKRVAGANRAARYYSGYEV